MIKIFESDRIDYVKLDELLFNDLVRMYSNLNIQKQIFKKEFTKEQISNWINKLILNEKSIIYGMIEKDSGLFIGMLEIIEKAGKTGEITICITPDMQSKHYGYESIKATIEYAKSNLNINEFELYVYKNNKNAIHCYEKVGFIQTEESLSENDIHMKL